MFGLFFVCWSPTYIVTETQINGDTVILQSILIDGIDVDGDDDPLQEVVEEKSNDWLLQP